MSVDLLTYLLGFEITAFYIQQQTYERDFKVRRPNRVPVLFVIYIGAFLLLYKKKEKTTTPITKV